jgi:ParB-like chromosome segregation protein Spo0J
MSDKNKFDIDNFIKEAQKYIKSPTSWVCVNEVKKWDINPRTITAEAMERLKNKIKKYPSFFFARPILVNFTGDNNKLVVFAGNQRLEASLQLEMEKVPVVIFNLQEKRSPLALAGG